jgi:hypothetical protein
MDEITALREIRPTESAAEMDAMRRAARDQFVAGTGARPARPARRTSQQWRLPVMAGGLTAAVAAGVAACLVLTGVLGSAPAQRPTASRAGTVGHAGTVVTAAWTVREDADGTVTIQMRQYADPAALQQTLQADGINAIVRSIPYRLETVTLPRPATSSVKRPLRSPHPTCLYSSANNAPRAVQDAVVTISTQTFPLSFVIHPDAMPQRSALLLTFMAGVPVLPKNGYTGIRPLVPVVLNNGTVPACVPVPTKTPPTSGPNAVPRAKVKGA